MIVFSPHHNQSTSININQHQSTMNDIPRWSRNISFPLLKKDLQHHWSNFDRPDHRPMISPCVPKTFPISSYIFHMKSPIYIIIYIHNYIYIYIYIQLCMKSPIWISHISFHNKNSHIWSGRISHESPIHGRCRAAPPPVTSALRHAPHERRRFRWRRAPWEAPAWGSDQTMGWYSKHGMFSLKQTMGWFFLWFFLYLF